jgi:hypothetical protein
MWQSGRAAISTMSDRIIDLVDALLFESAMVDAPKAKVRRDVRVDRDRREIRVGRGPPIPFGQAEVRVFRDRKEQDYFRGGGGTDSFYSEKTTVVTFEVYVKCGNVRATLGKFDSRIAAEKYAREVRDTIASA